MITEKEIRDKFFLGSEEAAEFLNVTHARIRALLKDKRFEGAFKIKSTWLIPKESVKNFVPNKIGAPKGKKHKRRDNITSEREKKESEKIS